MKKRLLEIANDIIKELSVLGNKAFFVINSGILCNYNLSRLIIPAISSLVHLLLTDNHNHNPKYFFHQITPS